MSRLSWLFRTLLIALLGLFSTLSQSQEADPSLRDFLNSTINQAETFEDRFDAEVWLVDMSERLSRFVKDPEQRLELLRLVHHYATASDLPPELVLAVIEVESHFDSYAVSRVGAQGLMQVMPFWKNEIGRPQDNLTQVATNLRYGCRILQYYLDRNDNHLMKALAGYNGSKKYVYSQKVQRAWREHWRTRPLLWAKKSNSLYPHIAQ